MMMKNVYPVFFTITDTIILVEVPDLEILTEGNDMVNALEMARDAIELKCVSMEDDGIEIPLPSEIGSLDVNSGAFAEEGTTLVSLVDIDSGEYRRKIDTKAVRKNVTIPSWLNYEAEQAGINVSRVLQEALMDVLNVQRNF
ncbi:MAG: type II toxin-antitoxin system HicB family antitoxin [Bacteroidales bacterium]|nr:type II toxin-antitoxin system HicB family antitoxin [Bacteroidales bacterium]